MNFFISFFLFIILQSYANNGLGQERITLTLKNVSIDSAIKVIEKESKLHFIYEDNQVRNSKFVTLNFYEAPLINILNALLVDTKLEYKIEGQSIVLYKQRNVDQTVTGLIVDESGLPVEGASIIEKATGKGTITDAKGKFTIVVPNENTVLIISSVGFANQEIKIGKALNLGTITLKRSGADENLKEVVVTALGIKRQEKSLGYSITKVGGDNIKKSNELNVVNALAGKVAGVRVAASSGGVDASSSIIIRGQNSLRGNNQPLFVIDGIQIDNNQVTVSGEGARDYGNNLADINPDDIEEISVLKGPNAAALYGSRASNGVILITTKKGIKKPGLGLTYSSTYMLEKAYDLLPLQNIFGSGEGPRFTDGFFSTNNGTPVLGVAWNNFGPKMDGTKVIGFSGKPVSYSPQPDNIQDMYRTGYSYVNNLSFAGAGNGGSTYRISYTNRRNSGIVDRNSANKNTINFRGTQQITSLVKADVSFSYSTSKVDGRPLIANSPLLNRYAGFFPRDISFDEYKSNYKQADGAKTGGCPWCYTNTYWELYEKTNEDKSDRLIGSIDVDYKMAPWLNLKLKASTDALTRNFKNSASGSAAGGTGTDASYSTSEQIVRQYTYEFLFNASKRLSKDFDLSLNVGGQSWQSNGRGSSASTRGGLRIAKFYSISNSMLDPLGDAYISNKKINSLYSFGQLSYKGYLFLDVTARNDWSSTLPAANNSYFYPSASLSFVVTDALKNKPDFLDFGKVRTSWAKVGSSAQDPYMLNSVYYSAGTYGSIPLANAPTSVPLGNLKPESTESNELGVDLRFFKKRLSFDLTLYKSATTNQIIQIDVPLSSGAGTALINAGRIENRGIELLLSGVPYQSKTFSWTSSFNYASNRNKVVELNGLEAISIATNGDGPVAVLARPGKPYGDIEVWVPKKDDKGNVIVNPDGQIATRFAREVVGNIQPKWTGGFSNTFEYKQFSLSALIECSMGGQFYSYTKRWLTARGSSVESLFGRTADYGGIAWTDGQGRQRNDGIIANGVTANGSKNAVVIAAKDYYNQSYQDNFPLHVLDASYVSLREVSLAYNLPAKLLGNKKIIRSANFSLVGRNLALLYNAAKIVNPLATSYGSGNGSKGIEAGAFAPTRSYGISFSVSF